MEDKPFYAPGHVDKGSGAGVLVATYQGVFLRF